MPVRDRIAAGMAWAVDARTKTPVYIGDLKREQTGLRCGCICPACNARLQAVGAGNDANSQRVPFFRHHVAQQGPGCKYRVAELAALRLLSEKDTIEIPAPRRQAGFVGQSGTLYQAEVVGTAIREEIVGRRLVSETQALLTLASGRQVLLVLRGYQDVGEFGSVFAVVQVQVDDPEVAWLSREQIIAQSELTSDWLHVLRHKDDEALQQRAEDEVRQKALDQLDVDPASLNLPIGATKKQASESLIHWALRDALLKVGWLQVPEYRQNVSAVGQRGQVHIVAVVLPPRRLRVREVRTEVLFEGYRPDIVCLARDESDEQGGLGEFQLLVEVAVTHKVTVEKLALLKRDDVACIELQVGRLAQGGTVTRPQLRDLVAHDLASKLWLHHPATFGLIAEAQAKANAARDASDATGAAEEAKSVAHARMQAERALEEREREAAKVRWATRLTRDDALTELRGLLRHRWADGSEVTSNGMAWANGEFERTVKSVIASEGLDGRTLGKVGIAWKLDAIVHSSKAWRQPLDVKLVLGIGLVYAPFDLEPWLGLMHMAIDHCRPLLPTHLEDQYQAQRTMVLASLEQGQETYARRTNLDDLLVGMFPDLRPVFVSEFGTRIHSERVRLERLETQRREAEDRKAAELLAAAAEAQRLAEATAERESRRVPEEVATVTRQWGWRDNPKVPASAKDAVGYLKLSRHKNPGEEAVTLVTEGWHARSRCEDFAMWFGSLRFSSVLDVQLARELLEAGWIVQSKLPSSARPTHTAKPKY